MYETIRIVEKLKPKYILWENVKNLLSKKHKHNFDNYIERLNQLGYNSYYKVLNAKDYGVPQNRERVYTISIRKDVDKSNFEFPKSEELKIKLKDVLEENVDEKYYLSNDLVNSYIENKEDEGNVIGKLVMNKWQDSMKRIYDINKYSPTINTCQGGNLEPKIKVIGNYMPSNYDASRIVDNNGIAPTVKKNHGTVTATNTKDFRIRKLTPREFWRLMTFDDEDFDKAKNSGVSNSQLYKQARKFNSC